MSTYLIAERVLVVVYNLQLRFQLIKLTLTLLKVKKDIFKAISILKLANKKVFLKNQDFPSLFFIKKNIIYQRCVA